MGGMKIGVSASSYRVTSPQLLKLERMLIRLCASELHHGDCIVGDAAAHAVAVSLGIRTVGHPPEIERKRAYCICDELRPVLPYLDRNRVIVQETEALIGLPKDFKEEKRSGTWMTIRYARSIRRPVYVIWPDGSGIIHY